MSEEENPEEGQFASYDYEDSLDSGDESCDYADIDQKKYKKGINMENNDKKIKENNSVNNISESNSNKILNSDPLQQEIIDRSAAKTVKADKNDILKAIENKNPFSKLTNKEIIKNFSGEINLKKHLSDSYMDNNENNNKNTILSNNSLNNKINKNGNKDLDNILEEVKDKKEEKLYKLKTSDNNDEIYFKNDPKIEMMRLVGGKVNSYSTSILICIGNIDDLKNFFLDKKEAEKIYKSISSKRLSFVTQRLFVHLFYDKKNKTYELSSFQEVLKEKNIIFKQEMEINPNICLNYILDQLHNELNLKNDIENSPYITAEQSKKKEVLEKGMTDFLQKNDSIISKTFSWYEMQEIYCNNCDKYKYIFKSFFTFDLDIFDCYKEKKSDSLSISDCLDYAISKKKLPRFYCDYCRVLSNARKTKYIANTPKIFAFIVDRGDFNGELMKINFTLDSEINIEKYTENIETSTNYELIGVISIIGKKYISFVNIQKTWFVFDGSNIQKVEKNVVLNKDNYNVKHIPCILFYKLV